MSSTGEGWGFLTSIKKYLQKIRADLAQHVKLMHWKKMIYIIIPLIERKKE